MKLKTQILIVFYLMVLLGLLFSIKPNKSITDSTDININSSFIFHNAITSNDPDQCKKIPSEKEKDNCYFFLRDCEEISNQEQSYLCRRIHQRIHILELLISPYKISGQQDNDELTHEDIILFNDALNTFKKGVDIAREDYDTALMMCDSLLDVSKADECKYYLAIYLISQLEKNPQEKIKLISNHCDTIVQPDMKSECYFLLADEVVFLSDHYNFIGNISGLCTKSSDNKDYGCFHHVAFYMSLNMSKYFGTFIPKRYSYNYFLRRSLTFIGHNINLSDSSLFICNVYFSDNFKPCIIGLLRGAIAKNSNEVKAFSGLCTSLSGELRHVCFFKIGLMLKNPRLLNKDTELHTAIISLIWIEQLVKMVQKWVE